MASEIIVYECESCSSRFDSREDIRDCMGDCGCEVCLCCQVDDGICEDCLEKRDAIDKAEHNTEEDES